MINRTSPVRINQALSLIALSMVLALTSCATITSPFIEQPITTNPEERTMGEALDDKNTRARLQVNLTKYDARFRDANVDIHVNVGTVLLVGQVPEKSMISLATQLVSKDSQVKTIHNHLTAEPNLGVGVSSNDKWLAVKVRSQLFANDDFSDSSLDIVVEKGVVYIMGRVTQETANKAVAIAAEVGGVQKVVKVFQIIN
ncbi:BON domain-containing protein [Reinekea thalattae]|uniref:BON domain-containing protein n=1 Tax=Reinekea thalattae TaxID=2593301 RepID=A0A5C8Z1M7_9GAMM|nr:BON domain-containing protein [Reinekea thalattae]TXR51985.1 BON domain-containing protein [Reinekea thalattae]